MAIKKNELYSSPDGVEAALDKADRLAAEDTVRMSHEEVFEKLRRKINAQ